MTYSGDLIMLLVVKLFSHNYHSSSFCPPLSFSAYPPHIPARRRPQTRWPSPLYRGPISGDAEQQGLLFHNHVSQTAAMTLWWSKCSNPP